MNSKECAIIVKSIKCSNLGKQNLLIIDMLSNARIFKS